MISPGAEHPLPRLWRPVRPSLILPGRHRAPALRAQPLRVTNLTGFGGGGSSVLSPPANTYVADAVVVFDDRLHTAGADLTGNVDSKTGMCSFWFNRNSGVGATQRFWHSEGGRVKISFFPSNVLAVEAVIPGGLDIRTTTAITDTANWHHFLASWDRNAPGETHLLLDGVDDKNEFNNTDDATDYTRLGHAVGSLEGSKSNILQADLADFWFAPGQFRDFSVQANVDKFRDGLGKPVDLGDDGSDPTGTKPLVFFTGDASVWNAGTNAGSAQDFTMDGSVTDASSSPSD